MAQRLGNRVKWYSGGVTVKWHSGCVTELDGTAVG